MTARFQDTAKRKSPRARTYSVDGQRYPSVTTVLSVIRKPFLEQWRGRLGNRECDRISRESAELGTRVHQVCEWINSGDYGLKSERIIPFELVAFHESYAGWFEANVETVLGIEKALVSRQHRFAGTADLVARLRDGSTVVVDLKTGGIVSAEFGLQLAAYRQALLEQDGIEADRRLVVQLPRAAPGTLVVHEFDDLQADWRAFLAASILWWRLFSKEALS